MFKPEIIRMIGNAEKWQKRADGNYIFKINGNSCDEVFSANYFANAVRIAADLIIGGCGSGDRYNIFSDKKTYDVTIEVTEDEYLTTIARYARERNYYQEKLDYQKEKRQSFLDVIVETIHARRWRQNNDNSWSVTLYEGYGRDIPSAETECAAHYINEAFRVLTSGNDLIKPIFSDNMYMEGELLITIPSKLALQAAVATYVLYEKCAAIDIILSPIEAVEIVYNANNDYANLASVIDYEKLLAEPYTDEIPTRPTFYELAVTYGQTELAAALYTAVTNPKLFQNRLSSNTQYLLG